MLGIEHLYMYNNIALLRGPFFPSILNPHELFLCCKLLPLNQKAPR